MFSYINTRVIGLNNDLNDGDFTQTSIKNYCECPGDATVTRQSQYFYIFMLWKYYLKWWINSYIGNTIITTHVNIS